jgi:hypothetical protein
MDGGSWWCFLAVLRALRSLSISVSVYVLFPPHAIGNSGTISFAMDGVLINCIEGQTVIV